jgi:hypothetical protein
MYSAQSGRNKSRPVTTFRILSAGKSQTLPGLNNDNKRGREISDIYSNLSK